MKLRKLVGSGLTRYAVDVLAPDEWRKKANEDPQFLAQALSTYPEHLLSWREWATRMLAKASRPTTNDPVVVAPDGTWARSEFPPTARTGKVHIIAGLSYSDAEEEASIEWYAAKIAALVDRELELLRPQAATVAPLRLGEQANRSADLSSRAIAAELGATVERVRWKFRHEAAALAGYKAKERVADFQKEGAASSRKKGADKERQIEPLFRKALNKSSKPAQELTIAQTIHLMRKIDPDALKKWKLTTLRRHVKLLLARTQ